MTGTVITPFAAAAASLPARIDLLPREAGDALELPPPYKPGTRASVPLLASVVPVLGAVALWLVTGSLLSLWLAALGPLIAVATVLDGARGSRRDRRRANAEAAVARVRVARAIEDRHAHERERRWARHPDVAAFAARDSEVWRHVRGRVDALVVGAGAQASGLRVLGGGDDAESVQLRTRAATVSDAPVIVPASAGIVVVGNEVLGAAVVRAIVAQLCLALPPGELRIVGALRGEHAWAESFPHRRASTGLTMALAGPGESVASDADYTIVRIESETPPPPRCRVVITVASLSRAVVDFDGDVQEAAPEALGLGQAQAIASELSERARQSLGLHASPEPVVLTSLLVHAPSSRRGTLPAVIGMEAGEARVIDLVGDGPHAIVAGVTGAGKSELLVTWIVSLCATHTTAEVSFLLADFKGGTAFDALAELPHVTGVLTDLDGSGARRAIESLRAEIRWREGELARCGARDLLDPRVQLPRLVIVVDEFAALLGDHPELHAVFADVAARGRALGMHLVLGTQRPSGVVRESLLANCPLRISLRVSDATDSRALLGTGEAAELPGGAESRGLALVRTGSDAAPRRVQIALSAAHDVATVVAGSRGARPRRPWLPALPDHLSLDDVRTYAGADGVDTSSTGEESDRMLVLGLADEPEHQRQRPVGFRLSDRGVLIVGGAGTGKSTALRTLAAQAPGEVIVVPSDGEGAWDAVTRLCDMPPRPGAVVIIDDLDAVTARLPHEYARELAERLERMVRGAGDAGVLVVAAAQRLGAGTTRLAELLPRRVVLAAASRAEYLAAGGEATHYAPGDGPGRARLDGRAVQIAFRAGAGVAAPAERSRAWHPTASVTGFVLRRSPAGRAAIAEWERGGASIITLETFVSDGEWAAGEPVVVVGEPDDWQRHWRALTAVRSDHDLVIDVACAADLRQLTGERSLPPFCEPGRPRGWLLSAGGSAVRIVLPAVDQHPLGS